MQRLTPHGRALTRARAPRSLDPIDLRILSMLRENGRMSKVRLARAIGLSPTPCGMRIDRLEAARFIRGYHADIDIERLGNLSQFIVAVRIRNHTPEKARQFETILRESIHIVECDAMSGSIDYAMRILARNVRHYHEIMKPFLVMEIDYTTYPISKTVKDRANLDLPKLLGVECRAMDTGINPEHEPSGSTRIPENL